MKAAISEVPLSLGDRADMHSLRVGVILDSYVVPAWVKYVLEQLDRSESLELVMLISSDMGVIGSQVNHSNRQLFRAWEWFDYEVFKKRTTRPDATELVAFVPRSSVAQVHYGSRGAERLDDDVQLQSIRKADLDVLLDFTSGTTRCEARNCARYGQWSLGCLPTELLFAHIHQGLPDIEVRLEVIQNGAAASLQCARYATDFVSLFRNCNEQLWRRGDAILRILARLHRFGSVSVQQRLEQQEPSTHALPGNMRMGLFLLRLLLRIAGRILARAFVREDWFIAYRRSAKMMSPEIAPSEFIVLRPPRDRFYADPFVVERNGRTYIFFEDYRQDQRKALISFVQIDPAGNCSEPEVVLEADYHLSYPCVFEWQGNMYLLPESTANGMVELYRATDFPRGWRREHILIQGDTGADPTILEYKAKFWLFASGLNGSRQLYRGDDELFLFFSDTPFGPWTSHPMNPVNSDVRSCRPAGRLFFEDGHLIRPSQDCSKRYGYAVSLNRVDVLSETEYAETPIATISPHWFRGNIGTHTFNQDGKYQVIDGRVWVSSFLRWPPGRFVQRVLAKSPIVNLEMDEQVAGNLSWHLTR